MNFRAILCATLFMGLNFANTLSMEQKHPSTSKGSQEFPAGKSHLERLPTDLWTEISKYIVIDKTKNTVSEIFANFDNLAQTSKEIKNKLNGIALKTGYKGDKAYLQLKLDLMGDLVKERAQSLHQTLEKTALDLQAYAWIKDQLKRKRSTPAQEYVIDEDNLGTEVLALIFNNRIKESEKLTKLPKLIEAGVNINKIYAATRVSNFTFLMAAVNQNSEQLVNLLLNNKADPNIKLENNNTTALIFALKNDLKPNINILRALLVAGANPNQTERFSETVLKFPLELSVYSSDPKVVQLLIDYKADVKGTSGRKALSAAIAKNNSRIVKLLLDSGLNPNYGYRLETTRYPGESNATTPLITALSNDQAEIFYELLDHNADPLYKAPNKVSALEHAQKLLKQNKISPVFVTVLKSKLVQGAVSPELSGKEGKQEN